MKNTSKLLAFALGTVTAASAFANQDGPYSMTFAQTSTTWNTTLSFPKFNVSGGTLTSIDFTLAGNVFGNANAESLDGAPSTLSLDLKATLTLQRPNNTSIVVTVPTINRTFNASIFDGQIDFGGTSGITFSEIGASTSNNNNLSSAGDLALFSGAGNITLPISGVGASTASGAGNIVSLFNTSAGATGTVTYNYTTGVPEPKVYGAIGAVACLGLLGYRRFRSQKA